MILWTFQKKNAMMFSSACPKNLRELPSRLPQHDNPLPHNAFRWMETRKCPFTPSPKETIYSVNSWRRIFISSSTVDRFLLISWKFAFVMLSCEDVKGDFRASIHTLLLIHSNLSCGDRSEGSDWFPICEGKRTFCFRILEFRFRKKYFRLAQIIGVAALS